MELLVRRRQVNVELTEKRLEKAFEGPSSSKVKG
jgi:hypothetical protein